jgi:hypothetical protein
MRLNFHNLAFMAQDQNEPRSLAWSYGHAGCNAAGGFTFTEEFPLNYVEADHAAIGPAGGYSLTFDTSLFYVLATRQARAVSGLSIDPSLFDAVLQTAEPRVHTLGSLSAAGGIVIESGMPLPGGGFAPFDQLGQVAASGRITPSGISEDFVGATPVTKSSTALMASGRFQDANDASVSLSSSQLMRASGVNYEGGATGQNFVVLSHVPSGRSQQPPGVDIPVELHAPFQSVTASGGSSATPTGREITVRASQRLGAAGGASQDGLFDRTGVIHSRQSIVSRGRSDFGEWQWEDSNTIEWEDNTPVLEEY